MRPSMNIEIRTTVNTQPPHNPAGIIRRSTSTYKDIIIKSFSTHPGVFTFSVTCQVNGTDETFTTTFYDEYVHCGAVSIPQCKTVNALKFLKLDDYMCFIRYLSEVIFRDSLNIHVGMTVVRASADETPKTKDFKELQMTIKQGEGSFMLRLN